MPINRSPSNEAREENIKQEISEGKDPRQAVAIGYSEQRQARKKSHPQSHERKHTRK